MNECVSPWTWGSSSSDDGSFSRSSSGGGGDDGALPTPPDRLSPDEFPLRAAGGGDAGGGGSSDYGLVAGPLTSTATHFFQLTTTCLPSEGLLGFMFGTLMSLEL